jgi:formylglycine-generating enzyme required for sulfatase activity
MNPWGLFDVFGNVSEWSWDRYDNSGTSTSQLAGVDPQRVSRGTRRVTRGGSYSSSPTALRAAYRGHQNPGDRGVTLGVRVVRTAR